MQARQLTTSLCVCRVVCVRVCVCARSVNLICMLLAAYMYSTVIVKAHACTRTHKAGMCMCECVSVVVAEQRDPFCQSGQCWKPVKATFYSRHFASPAPPVSPLSLCSICSAGQRNVVLCLRVSECARVCARCLWLYFWTCMNMCDRAQGRAEDS